MPTAFKSTPEVAKSLTALSTFFAGIKVASSETDNQEVPDDHVYKGIVYNDEEMVIPFDTYIFESAEDVEGKVKAAAKATYANATEEGTCFLLCLHAMFEKKTDEEILDDAYPLKITRDTLAAIRASKPKPEDGGDTEDDDKEDEDKDDEGDKDDKKRKADEDKEDDDDKDDDDKDDKGDKDDDDKDDDGDKKRKADQSGGGGKKAKAVKGA